MVWRSSSNVRVSATSNGVTIGTLQLNRSSARPGRWKLVLQVTSPVVGTRVTQPFTGTLRLGTARVTAKDPPTDPSVKVPAGKPTLVKVRMKNQRVPARAGPVVGGSVNRFSPGQERHVPAKPGRSLWRICAFVA